MLVFSENALIESDVIESVLLILADKLKTAAWEVRGVAGRVKFLSLAGFINKHYHQPKSSAILIISHRRA